MSKKSTTSNLHELFADNPPRPEIENVVAEESDQAQLVDIVEQVVKKPVKISNLVRTRYRHQKKISKLEETNLLAEKRVSASEKSETEAWARVKLLEMHNVKADAKLCAADKKVAGLLEKESTTISDAQTKINNVEIKSKAATRENGKRSAEVLEKYQEASKMKSRKFEDKSKKTLSNLNRTISDLNQTIRNLNAEKERDTAAALEIQKDMSKQIEGLQNKLPDHHDKTCIMERDDLVENTLEQLFRTLESKNMRSGAIKCIRTRLNSYDIDKVSREVNETRDEPVSTCTILGYYCFALCSDNVDSILIKF